MTNLFGHDYIKRQLISASEHDRIGHAYIFEGADGIGKTTAAFWFAKLSLCSGKSGTPCNKCNNCIKAEAGSHPDIIYADDAFIANTKYKATSIEAMRIIKKDVYTKPFMAGRKFYIIPDAEKLLTVAQNSLLKVFEEPPSYCTIILICENAGLLMQTIRSRAVTIRFSPLTDDDMRRYLSGKTNGNTDKIIKLSRGIPGIADMLISDEDYLKELDNITSAFSDYLSSNGDMTGITGLITKDNSDFAITCLESYASSMIESCGVSDNTPDYINIFEILQNTRRRLKCNCNFNLTVTDMLIKCWEAIHG